MYFLGTDPIIPLCANLGKKMENVYHFCRQSKQLLFNNAFKNISRFQAMSVKFWHISAP